MKAGQFIFDTVDEDIHMAIERRMTEIIGPVGGKLHTGRSRNDQTTVDSKMHMRATIREIQQDIVNLQEIIVNKAENNIDAIMPGYTHLQTGQPILLSHWIMAYYWMLRRDWTRFEDLYHRMGECPLARGSSRRNNFSY